jgi:hypothetical protein
MMVKVVNGWLVLRLAAQLIVSFKLWRADHGAWRYVIRQSNGDVRSRRIFAFGAFGLNFSVNIVRAYRGALIWAAEEPDINVVMRAIPDEPSDEFCDEWDRLAAAERG